MKAVPPLNTTTAGVASSVCRLTVEHLGNRSGRCACCPCAAAAPCCKGAVEPGSASCERCILLLLLLLASMHVLVSAFLLLSSASVASCGSAQQHHSEGDQSRSSELCCRHPPKFLLLDAGVAGCWAGNKESSSSYCAEQICCCACLTWCASCELQQQAMVSRVCQTRAFADRPTQARFQHISSKIISSKLL